MARKRRAESQRHTKKPTNPSHSNRRRNPNADVRFSLLAHSLGSHGVRPFLVRPTTAADAPPVIRTKLFLQTYKLSIEPLKAGARKNFISWSGGQGELQLAATGRILSDYPQLIRQFGGTPPPTIEMNGESILPIEVPPWSDTLEGMKAVALSVAGKQLGHRPVNIRLSKSTQAKALANPNGPASFLQSEISRRLRRAGFKDASFALFIDTNIKSNLHLHGCIGLPDADLHKPADRRRALTALKPLCEPGDNRAILFKRWTDYPEGFGGYMAKYALVTKGELRATGAKPRVTLKSGKIGSVAAKWWDETREKNLSELIQAVAVEEGINLSIRDAEAERRDQLASAQKSKAANARFREDQASRRPKQKPPSTAKP